MLSIAPVRSAGGAANYFAKDDYYTGEHASEMSEWGGEGASALGLSGDVGKVPFETLLNGALPDGTVVNAHEHRRAGIDLTFSMPKSASVLAYVAGDERLLTAHRTAVRQTMTWWKRPSPRRAPTITIAMAMRCAPAILSMRCSSTTRAASSIRRRISMS